jgi:hypothetical protein
MHNLKIPLPVQKSTEIALRKPPRSDGHGHDSRVFRVLRWFGVAGECRYVVYIEAEQPWGTHMTRRVDVAAWKDA